MTIWLTSIHLFTTLAMTGVIWFVQIVHYPLFQKVGSNNFVDYETAHTRLTGQIVMPLMLGELITGFALPMYIKQTELSYLLYIGLALIVINWLVTFLFFVPMHRTLCREFDLEICRKLVSLNWLRTVIWSLRSAIVLTVFMHYIEPGLCVG